MEFNKQNILNKVKEAQQKIEATKKRLDTVFVDAASGNGKVKVTVTANRTIKSIDISEDLTDNEEIADYLILALNEALSKANAINEAELAAAAKDGMPNIPGF